MVSRQDESICIEVRLPDADTAERASAEAWEAGVEGVEERSASEGSTLLLLYAKPEAAARVRAAVAGIAGARVSEPRPVEDKDWSLAWREGLEAVRVGTRLVVRPSWVDAAPAAEVDLVIDPGQAFGTGGHVSTRLVLEWLERRSREAGGLGAESRVLDVGAGSGVLALAALGLGAGSAVAFDLDPEAGRATRHWAAHNGLSDRLRVFVGPIEAQGATGFDWVLANLLKREVLPLTGEIARVTRPGGILVLSGLLDADEAEVVEAFANAGFVQEGARHDIDPSGDAWVAPLLRRR